MVKKNVTDTKVQNWAKVRYTPVVLVLFNVAAMALTLLGCFVDSLASVSLITSVFSESSDIATTTKKL